MKFPKCDGKALWRALARESKGSREVVMGKGARRDRLKRQDRTELDLRKSAGLLTGFLGLLFGDNTAAAELSVPAALLINCKIWLLVRAWVAGGGGVQVAGCRGGTIQLQYAFRILLNGTLGVIGWVGASSLCNVYIMHARICGTAVSSMVL